MAHSRRFSSTSTRRRTSWVAGPETGVNGAPQSISSSLSQLATTAIAVGADGFTLVRTRGELNMRLGTAAASTDGFHGAFGIAIANGSAVTAGSGSIQTPLDDEAWDGWLYHRYFNLMPGAAIAAAAAQDNDFVNATSAALRFEVDSKAMRKLNAEDSIYAIIEVVEVGVASMAWAFNCRQLVKLP